ncbi:hypothetical protein EGW08_007749, partial [Elysia chlorotica]
QLDRGVVGQGVGKHGLAHQDEVDHELESCGWEVVGDHLHCLVAVRFQIPEQGFEDGRCDVGPRHHAAEPGPVAQLALQRGQEDLRRVGEHDDAQRDRESPDIYAYLYISPAPLSCLEKNI